MKITLNLATRPYADQGPALKRLRIGMAVLVVLLAALGFGLQHFHQAALRMAAQEDAVSQSIAKIRGEELKDQAEMEQPANARVLKQAEFLNGLFDEKAFSWTAAMEDLERVLPAGVQVTAIEPARAKDGRLTLHLRISGQRERSVDMVRNMEHSRRFVSPRISGENAENTSQGGFQPVADAGKVSFEILAEYNPATLDERKAEIAAMKRARPGLNSGLNPGLNAPAAASMPGLRPMYVPPNPQMPGQAFRPGVQPGIQPGMRPGQQSGAQDPMMYRRRPSNTTPILRQLPAQGGPQ